MTYNYSFVQWIALFIIYCFAGWIWETCYVSACKKKWVNRGFLKGPFLPSYGSGAILILLVTIPLMNQPVLVYAAGLVTSTVLEYFTGVAMEAIFKVRYWDYSQKKFNFQGHICLSSSIAWGFFSLALVYGIHKPFDRLVTYPTPQVLTPIVYVLSLLIAGDFAVSFKTAIELRDVLIQLEKARHEAELLKKRMDVLQAFWSDDMEKQKEDFDRWSEDLKDRLELKMDELGDRLEFKMDELEDQLEWKMDVLEDHLKMKKEDFQKYFAELEEKRKVMLEQGKSMAHLTKGRISLILRHPSAVSVKYKEVFEDLIAGISELNRR